MRKTTGKLAETWGLGASASALFVLLVFTGGVLMFHYRPTSEWAWIDVVNLREVSWAGSLRKLHYWGAQILVIVVWLHLLRTFLVGAHRSPRHGNWWVGVGLLVLVMAMATTGHLLPWDEAAVSGWNPRPTEPSVAEAAEPRGVSLLWIYVFHCVVLPLSAGGLIVHHWRRYLHHREPRGD